MSDPSLPTPDPTTPAGAGYPGQYGAQPPAAPAPGPVYPQAPYQQVQYPVATAAPTQSNDAVVALVLSIASWLFCPVVLAIVALVFAAKAKRAIAASNGWVTGEGMATAAKVISWINIALFFVGLLVGVVLLVVLAATSTSATYNG